MARIKDRSVSADYLALAGEAQELGERNDCSVRACAILCEVPYAVAAEAFLKAGREPGKGSYDHVCRKAYASLGYEIVPLGGHHIAQKWAKRPAWVDAILAEYPASFKAEGLTSYHPKRFPKVWGKKPPYLILARHHHAAFKDGVVHDWSGGKALRIICLYEIKKIRSPE